MQHTKGRDATLHFNMFHNPKWKKKKIVLMNRKDKIRYKSATNQKPFRQPPANNLRINRWTTPPNFHCFRKLSYVSLCLTDQFVSVTIHTVFSEAVMHRIRSHQQTVSPWMCQTGLREYKSWTKACNSPTEITFTHATVCLYIWILLTSRLPLFYM